MTEHRRDLTIRRTGTRKLDARTDAIRAASSNAGLTRWLSEFASKPSVADAIIERFGTLWDFAAPAALSTTLASCNPTMSDQRFAQTVFAAGRRVCPFRRIADRDPVKLFHSSEGHETIPPARTKPFSPTQENTQKQMPAINALDQLWA